MGTGRRIITTLSLALLAVGLTPRVAEAADQPTGPGESRTGWTIQQSDERGCTEIAYSRGGLESTVRPLVPDRYDLEPFFNAPGLPVKVRLQVNELTCRQVWTAGIPLPRPVTTVIVSAVGTNRDDLYVLFLATDNVVQYLTLRALGWPVDLLRRGTSGDVTFDETGPLTLSIQGVGGGWDHTVTGTRAGPFGAVESGGGSFTHDVHGHPWTLCYVDQFAVALASATGDLTATRLAAITAYPPVFAGAPAFLGAGDQRSRLTDGACPTPTP